MTNTAEDNAADSEGAASAIRHAKEQHDIDEAYRNLENTGDPWLDPWDEDPEDNAPASEGTAPAIRPTKARRERAAHNADPESAYDPWLDPWDEDPDSGE